MEISSCKPQARIQELFKGGGGLRKFKLTTLNFMVSDIYVSHVIILSKCYNLYYFIILYRYLGNVIDLNFILLCNCNPLYYLVYMYSIYYIIL